MNKTRRNSLDPFLINEWRWTYFLDKTIKSFSKFDLEPYPMQERFLQNEVYFGSPSNPSKANTYTWAFKSSKVRQARAACVHAGKSASVLNLVVSPSCKFDLPFFGADFVTLANGHLIALDFQPAIKSDPQHTNKVWDMLMPLHKHWQSLLPPGGPIPEEAKSYFSPCFLWTRLPLGEEGEDFINNVITKAYDDYLSLYIDLLLQSKEISNERSLVILEGQKKYMKYRSDKDPARGMLGRIFGSNWTESYINDVLFDLK